MTTTQASLPVATLSADAGHYMHSILWTDQFLPVGQPGHVDRGTGTAGMPLLVLLDAAGGPSPRHAPYLPVVDLGMQQGRYRWYEVAESYDHRADRHAYTLTGRSWPDSTTAAAIRREYL